MLVEAFLKAFRVEAFPSGLSLKNQPRRPLLGRGELPSLRPYSRDPSSRRARGLPIICYHPVVPAAGDPMKGLGFMASGCFATGNPKPESLNPEA